MPLLNGDETAEYMQLRYDTYKQQWSEQEQKIQVRDIGPDLDMSVANVMSQKKAILEDVDADVLTDVLSFVRETSPQTYDPFRRSTRAAI